MNVTIISGSRNPIGQTARALAAVRAGIEKSGSTAETILLPPLRIERCRQCEDSGWGLCIKECRCVIADDFAAIGVCVAGGGGGGAPACCRSLEQILTTCGFDVVDMVPIRRQNLEAKLAVLEAGGAWLVQH